jgi:Lon-like protease
LRQYLSPSRFVGGLIVLLLLTALILYRIPSDKYIILVDPAHPVAPFVKVQGAKTEAGGGSVYYVDVFERRARELEVLFPWLHSHASLVPADEIVPPCATAAQADAAQAQEMTFSQEIGAAVALRHLGYHVGIRPNGVVVSQLYAGTNAPCNLQPTDVIVAVNGSPTPTIAALHEVLNGVKPGAAIRLRLRRAGHLLTVRLKTVSTAADPGHAFIGITASQSAKITLPIHVSINLPRVGGPSAGLAFALEVMERLGKNVTHGHRVAATGEIELNGAVGAIGGIEQKTYGVRKSGADVFLVPVDQGNAREARRYAGSLRIIPVRTFAQALRALATLPKAS